MQVNISEEGLAFVHIDKFDTYNLDYTLGRIILPALVQFRKGVNSFPNVDNEDVPEHLWTDKTASWSVMNDHLMLAKWKYVLDTMIRAFEHVNSDEIWASELEAKEGLRLFGKYYGNLWS